MASHPAVVSNPGDLVGVRDRQSPDEQAAGGAPDERALGRGRVPGQQSEKYGKECESQTSLGLPDRDMASAREQNR